MSSSYIPVEYRRIVRERAGNRCEYCLLNEVVSDVGFEIDHVIAEKHGGQTHPDNLAYSCFYCNNGKGSDIASMSYSGVITRLFNPRIDTWEDHFRIDGDQITLLTPVAEATSRIIAFNSLQRCWVRMQLQALGLYP